MEKLVNELAGKGGKITKEFAHHNAFRYIARSCLSPCNNRAVM